MEFYEPLMGINNLSVFLRIMLAVICGGLIGMEREHKHRAAGFRTHILICLGATLTTMTSQYFWTYFNPNWIYAAENVSDMIPAGAWICDPARLGAQVVAGIGFVGAGTIIVTKRRQVKGLTTAAGLWATAIVGLAIGVGFYLAVGVVTALILLAEIVFSKLEFYIAAKARDLTLYVEYGSGQSVTNILEILKEKDVRVLDVEISKRRLSKEETVLGALLTEENPESSASVTCAILSVQFKKNVHHERLLVELSALDNVLTVQEL